MSPNTPTTPNTNVPETRTCPVCWTTFTITDGRANRRRYCSHRCRQQAYDRRQAGEPAPTPSTPEPPIDEPAIPEPAAHRDCPHCGGPITIVALLTTPQAARPTIPTNDDSVIPLRPAQPR